MPRNSQCWQLYNFSSWPLSFFKLKLFTFVRDKLKSNRNIDISRIGILLYSVFGIRLVERKYAIVGFVYIAIINADDAAK